MKFKLINESILEAASKIKITGGSCSTKWIYDTMQDSLNIKFSINGHACDFVFRANHGRYVVDGIDCDAAYINDERVNSITTSGGTARSYAISVPGSVMTSEPKENQKDFGFTGQYYKTTPIVKHIKEKLTDLLNNNIDIFSDRFLDKVGLSSGESEQIKEEEERRYSIYQNYEPVKKDVSQADVKRFLQSLSDSELSSIRVTKKNLQQDYRTTENEVTKLYTDDEMRRRGLKESNETEVLWNKGNQSIIKDGYGFGIDNGYNVNRFIIDNDGNVRYDNPPSKTMKAVVDRLVRQGKFDNPNYSDSAKYAGNTLKYGRGVKEDVKVFGAKAKKLNENADTKYRNYIEEVAERIIEGQYDDNYEVCEYVADKFKKNVNDVRDDINRIIASISSVDESKINEDWPKLLPIEEIPDNRKWQYSVGGVDVPYTSYEDAMAHLKDDYNIEDYREELQKFIDKETGRPHTFFVDATFDGRLCIDISWGDWKHEHGYADYLVKKFFNDKGLGIDIEVDTTASDGTDAYSATHYYEIDDLMFSGRPIEESLSDDAQYGVHQFSTDSIIFRGTEEECGKYIDKNKKLWDDAEVYMMTPDDPHYIKEAHYSVKFFQVFEAPKSPKENGKMIGQRGTLSDANAFGKEKVGKGNYIIKAVCDDGKIRPIDNDAEPSSYKMIKEAHYGGAYDIDDEAYFTKEDLVEFANDVIEAIDRQYDLKFDINELELYKGILYLSLVSENGIEMFHEQRIDMRKIKVPKDLNRYLDEFITAFRFQIDDNADYLYEGLLNEKSKNAYIWNSKREKPIWGNADRAKVNSDIADKAKLDAEKKDEAEAKKEAEKKAQAEAGKSKGGSGTAGSQRTGNNSSKKPGAKSTSDKIKSGSSDSSSEPEFYELTDKKTAMKDAEYFLKIATTKTSADNAIGIAKNAMKKGLIHKRNDVKRLNKLIDDKAKFYKLNVNEDFEYENDDWSDDGEVAAGKTFIESGTEYVWEEKLGSTVNMDFNNWAVWSARDIDNDILEYFVVEEDTGFIDWGPVDTAGEAREFLQSKVDDYSEEESDEDPLDFIDYNESLTEDTGASAKNAISSMLKDMDDSEKASTISKILDIIPDEYADKLFSATEKSLNDKQIPESDKQSIVNQAEPMVNDKEKLDDVESIGDLLNLIDLKYWAKKDPKMCKNLIVTILSIIAMIEPTPVLEIITAIVKLLPANVIAKIVEIFPGLSDTVGKLGSAMGESVNKVSYVEIVPEKRGFSHERHVFDTVDEMKAHVKQQGLTPSDIDSVVGLNSVEELFESDAK